LQILAPGSALPFIKRRQAAADVEALFAAGLPETDKAELLPHMVDLGPDRVRDLVELLESSSVEELTLENQGVKVSLRKASPVPPGVSSAIPAPTGADSVSGHGGDAVVTGPGSGGDPYHKVTASMVGTFYRSPAPGRAPYVEVGTHVNKGDPLCVLEAMKLMNELLSDVAGEVMAVLVEDGAAVEYGQPLFLIEPDAV
jgi:acetyl-CoA carboxylase biotin carboxyl carrier protein